MQYDFSAIEIKWQKKWQEDSLYKVTEDSDRPKCYVLDMSYPYPVWFRTTCWASLRLYCL